MRGNAIQIKLYILLDIISAKNVPTNFKQTLKEKN